MDFNEYLKKVGKDILDLSIKVIEENKGDDDKYYEYAYLKLQDGTLIPVDFRDYSSRLRISNYEWNDEYQRDEGYYFRIDTRTKYGFLVDVSLYYLDKKNIKYVASDIDYGNEELNKKEIETVIRFIDELYNKFLEVEYDKEKTQQVENYNYEEKCKYNKQKYNEAMNRLKESNPESEVLPSVEAAVNWWIEAIKSKDRIQPYGSDFSDFVYSMLLNDARDNTSSDDNQIEIFRESLISSLMKELSEGENIWVGINYRLLCNSLQEAGINSLRVPYRASMVVSVDSVVVHKNGINTEIYNSSEKKLTR